MSEQTTSPEKTENNLEKRESNVYDIIFNLE